MFKTASVAVTSSLATALLLGIAFANPSQGTNTARRSIGIKLEWVKVNPKVSESLAISVDDGQEGTVTRPTIDGRGNRQVMVRPRLNENGSITLNLHILCNSSPSESLDTVITVTGGETKVISASSSKGDSKALRGPTEELVFVTPTVE